MLMPGVRVYSAPIASVAVSAAQDIFHIQPGAVKALWIVRCSITQSSDYGDAAAEGLPIRLVRRSTLGTGGTAVTVVKHAPSDPTHEATLTRNITTVGTLVDTIGEESFNVQGGYFYTPIPEERVFIPAGGNRVAFHLPSAPADAITVSGWLTWMEVG